MVKKNEKDVRSTVNRYKVNKAETAILNKIASNQGMRLGKYVREVALNPSAFVAHDRKANPLEELGKPVKKQINFTSEKIISIREKVLADLDQNTCIQYSQNEDGSSFKIEGEDFILTFRKK